MTTYLVGDLHLRSRGDRAAADALVRLFDAAPDASFVFVGDALDLAAESADPRRAIRSSIGAFPELVGRIGDRASRRVRTTFVAGNHDASLPVELDTLHDALALSPADRSHVLAEPWFTTVVTERGTVHVEHGHLYDPDGSFGHPLGEISDDVGVALFKRFIVPLDAHDFVHRNEELPLALLMRVVRRYGPRAPEVVARYATSALSIVRDARRARSPSDETLARYALDRAVDRETLSLLHAAHATPTIARASSTFFRLYLDRVAATAAIVGGSALAIAAPPVGGSIATLGALALVASLVSGANRYRGRADRALAEGAAHAAEISGARTTILGHVHRDVVGDRYRNTASFAYSRNEAGHPYLRVEDDGTIHRGFAR